MVDAGGPEEQVVVLDDAGVPTGESVSIGEALARGAWHGKLVAWVVRDGGEVLLSRLPRDHVCEPARLAPTVSADVALGPPGEAVVAAVRTWLGATGRLGEPQYLGTFRSERRYLKGSAEAVLKQHQDVYLLRMDDAVEDLSPNPAFVDTVYELPLSKAVALLEYGGHVPAPGFDSMGRVSNALLVEDDLPSQGRDDMFEQLKAVAARLVAQAP